MAYVDGFVAAVPTANRETYLEYAKKFDALFIAHGALKAVECWGDDVPEGKDTSFSMAVKRQPGASPMPFDGKRMIYGGFDVILDM